jgi:REP element-mobilizing transposase RayT
MDKERYRRGSHTVTDFKYHFVRKTKYGHYMLQGDIALRLREIVTEVNLPALAGSILNMLLL